MDQPIIEIENIGKRYKIGANKERYLSLRDEMAKWLSVASRRKRVAKGEFWALKDINFTVQQGEAVGIIGKNGAGKSTLLKLLSKITPPTTGRIIRRGRVASLLEVGTGFHPELTGRENIYLNGSILGMSRREIARKFDEIVAFSEVEKFLDTPVKRYSSGMYVRLAFAVAAHLEPEILVVDEVLAVGDVEFQKKCLGKMSDVATAGRTVLFVSHNLSAVSQLCSRGILLNQGEIDYIGEVRDTLARYCKPLEEQAGETHVMNRFDEVDTKQREAEIRRVYLTRPDNSIADTFFIGDSMTINFDLAFLKEVPEFQMSFVVRSSIGSNIYHCVSTDTLSFFQGGNSETTVSATFPCIGLYPGNYVVDAIWLATKDGRQLDCVADCIGFNVPEGGPNVHRVLYKHAALIYEVPIWKNGTPNS